MCYLQELEKQRKDSQNKTTATDAVEVKDRSAGTSKFRNHSVSHGSRHGHYLVLTERLGANYLVAVRISQNSLICRDMSKMSILSVLTYMRKPRFLRVIAV